MNADDVLQLLERIKAGVLTPAEGVQKLAAFPYEDLEFAKIDHHRELRTGLPEVIFAAGKTEAQVLEIFAGMVRSGNNVLATRVTPAMGRAVCAAHPSAKFSEGGRTISLRQKVAQDLGKLTLVSAGTSDLPVAEEAAETAGLLGIEVQRIYDVGVAGLHRLLAHRADLAAAHVIIVCAGMEGALPSVVAGLVGAPVIAVPTSVGYGASFGGITALLGMLNSCAPNVATVNIDNGFGAACLAHAILRLARRK
jgi:NCAIR mutase (PurE)-related protein